MTQFAGVKRDRRNEEFARAEQRLVYIERLLNLSSAGVSPASETACHSHHCQNGATGNVTPSREPKKGRHSHLAKALAANCGSCCRNLLACCRARAICSGSRIFSSE
jgi:hypothetical protein